MRLNRWDEAKDGELGLDTFTRKLERLGYKVTRYVYPPGTYFAPHRHPMDKMDAVFSGRFRVSMEGETAVLGPGEAVRIPKGVEHSAEVVGDEVVVSLDGVKED